MKNSLLFKLCIVLSLLVTVRSVTAQVNISSNEAKEGRINRAGETNEWIVELVEDGTLAYSLDSPTMQLRSSVARVQDGVETKIYPPNRDGFINRRGWVNNKTAVEFKLQSENVLARGKYRISITGHNNGVGPYTLIVREPRFSAGKPPRETEKNDAGKRAIPLPNSDAKSLAELNTEVAALREELKSLRKELLEEIRKLKERR